jgi:type II pantothenate kinase
MGMFQDPTKMCEGAVRGDSSQIDMSVGDIYGGDYKGLDLPMNMIASTFGRLKDLDDCENRVEKDDVARSLLTMVAANNIIFSRIIA